jgi:hypothetical protein
LSFRPEAPAGVVRQSLTISVNDETAEAYSRHIYGQLFGEPTFATNGRPDIFALLSPLDHEDLAALYLQTEGYVLVPSTVKSSTAAYEWVMFHQKTGERAVLQVKSGNAWIDVAPLAEIPSRVAAPQIPVLPVLHLSRRRPRQASMSRGGMRWRRRRLSPIPGHRQRDVGDGTVGQTLGGGLYLRVSPTGSKSWVFRWQRAGRRGTDARHLVERQRRMVFDTAHGGGVEDSLDPAAVSGFSVQIGLARAGSSFAWATDAARYPSLP